MATTADRITLRDLPLPARLVLATFLISVGFGYFSALVQLHFQGGTLPGKMLPGRQEAVNRYHGPTLRPISQMERLLEATEGQFNGSGTMRPAFFEKSTKWRSTIKGLSEEQLQALRQDREGERLALLDWVLTGAKKEAWDRNDHTVQNPDWAAHPITPHFLIKEDKEGQPGPRRVKIHSIIEERCACCHVEEGKGSRDTNASPYPLDSYENWRPYLQVETSSGMSLTKLAQTTHVHLLGFSMLYCLTGLVFAFTSYPGWVRAIFGPFPLVAQLVDISCWWLGRADPRFAEFVVVTGGLVAVGLLIQLLGSLFNLFGKTGKVVLIVLVLALGCGGYVVKERVIDPYLRTEQTDVQAGGP